MNRFRVDSCEFVDRLPGAGAVFSEYNAVIPDLAFARHERFDKIVANDRFVEAPDLVVEVISPGKENRERDVHAKRQLYGKYSVEEYWIVDPDDHSVLVYRLQGHTLEEIVNATNEDVLDSPILPGFRLNVAEIFNLHYPIR